MEAFPFLSASGTDGMVFQNDLIMMRHIQSDLLELVKRSFRLLNVRWNRKT